MTTVRLLALDARRAASDGTRASELIAGASPDVVCVHSAPSLVRWRARCGALARTSGLVVVSGGRTGGGNLLMSTLGVEVVATRDVQFGRGPIRRPAGATLALLRRDGSPFVAVAASVDGDAGSLGELQDEIAAITALGETIGASDAPAVVSVAGLDRPGEILAMARTELPGGLYVDQRVTVDDPGELAEGTGARLIRLSLPQPQPQPQPEDKPAAS